MADFYLGLVVACGRGRKKVLRSAEEMQAMAQIVGWWEFLGSGLCCTVQRMPASGKPYYSILSWPGLV